LPGGRSACDYFYYYQMDQLQALRDARWKLHLPMVAKQRNWGAPEPASPLMLFDLSSDTGESHDLADAYPAVVERLLQQAQQMRPELGDRGLVAQGRRASGWVESPELLRITTR